jgi:hypothetical protein
MTGTPTLKPNAEPCPECDGSGDCWMCDGTGQEGGKAGAVKCGWCNGSAVCQECGGSGAINSDE